MIRFIDLGDQLLYADPHFAWFDTITDTFVEYAGDQVWDSWGEFAESFHADDINQCVSLLGDLNGNVFMENTRPIDRFKGLFPKNWPVNHTPQSD